MSFDYDRIPVVDCRDINFFEIARFDERLLLIALDLDP